MAKQLNVNLGFTADTSQARAQLQDLQNQLTKLVNTSSSTKLGIDNTKLNQAVRSAAELKTHLEAATNVNTGTLDFSKLSESIKRSGMDLNEYANRLRSLGPEGNKAFMSLTQAVANSEVPLRRVNATLAEMGTVLKNTIKWQISSSVLHGFMGAMSKAYGYAQDLNESLNNIRIVTGHSTDQMARFAEKANAAAKALNTTTTEYTNASLIYYQQGLNEKQVQERTDVTIKMANVARQSATVVSDQLTAIWNNFYDGSKSLEYYADVMTALGAATASSTDEIAGGLEKFAAIGETIGLSYEYAASALATITSNTRQSEEVVGTALKTIFARIQGLNLGETLDDGVTLNKYSEALKTVGISIFEANGQMKQMDAILDEMGAKWDTMNKAEQTALAQTVAGVRQYTQLVALMENWDAGDSDSMKANLETAYNSSGALDKQAEIYGESWEAARDRVSAALEDIYGKLLDDKFFITLLDGLSKAIDGASDFIDQLGGLEGVLVAVGALVTKIFYKDISKGLQNAVYSMKMLTKAGRDSVVNERTKFINNQISQVAGTAESTKSGLSTEGVYATAQKAQLEVQKTLIANEHRFSEEQLKANQHLVDRISYLSQVATESEKARQASQQNADTAKSQLLNNMFKPGAKPSDKQREAIQGSIDKMDSAYQAKAFLPELKAAAGDAKQFGKVLDDVKKALGTLDDNEDITKIVGKLEKAGGNAEKAKQEILKLDQALDNVTADNAGEIFNMDLGDKGASSEKRMAELDTLGRSLDSNAKKAANTKAALRELDGAVNQVNDDIKNQKGDIGTWSDGLVAVAGSIMNTVMAINMLKGAWDTVQDPDASGWEKISSVVMAAAMSFNMLSSTFNNKSLANMGSLVAKVAGESTKIGSKAKLAAEGLMSAGAGAGAFGSALLTIVPYILAAIAVIALLVVGITALVRAYNEDKIAAERAKKATQELSEANEKLKASYEELKSSFNAYDTAKTALEECVEGTVEWDEKLKEVHSTALAILELYPQLLEYSDALEYDKDTGLIKGINKERLEEIEAEKERAVKVSENAVRVGQIYQAKAAVQEDVTEVTRKIQGAQGTNVITGTKTVYNYASRTNETEQKSVNIDAEKLIQENAKDLSLLNEKDYENAVRNILNNMVSESGVLDSTYEFSYSLETLVDKFVKNRDAIQEIGKAYEQNAQILDNSAKLIISSEIADDLKNIPEENRGAVQEMASELAELSIEQEKKEIQAELNDLKYGDKREEANLEDKEREIIEEFERIQGLSAKDRNENFVKTTGKDGQEVKRYLQYNVEGQEDPQQYKIDVIAATVAAARVMEDSGLSVQTATKVLSSVDSVLDTFDSSVSEGLKNGFRGFIEEGNFERINKEEYDALLGKYGKNGKVDMDFSQLEEFFGVQGEELLAVLGVGSEQEAVDKFVTQINKIPEALSNVSDRLSKTPKKIFEASDKIGAFEQMTVEEKIRVADIYQKAFNKKGDEGLEKIDALFTSFGDKSDEFADYLDEIDWNSVSPESLIDDLNALGISIDEEAAPELKVLINLMKEIAGINMKEAAANYQTLKGYGDKGLKAGDRLSEDEYQELISLNSDFASYFAEGIGERVFMGDSKSFQDAADEQAHREWIHYLNGLPEDFVRYHNANQVATEVGYENIQGSSATIEPAFQDGVIRGKGTYSFDEEKAKNQLNYLKGTDYGDEEKLAEWEHDIEAGSMSVEDAQELAKEIENAGDQSEALKTNLETAKEDLETGWEKLNFSEIMDDIEDADLDVSAVQNYAQQLGELTEYAETSDLALMNMAKDQLRYDRAVESATSNMKKWKEELAIANETGLLSSEVMTELSEAYGDMLDLDPKTFSTGFLKSAENLKDMEDALNGSEEAYKRLQKAAKKDIELKVGFNQDGSFDKAFNDLLEQYYHVNSLDDIEIGAALDDTNFIAGLNKLLSDTNMTVQQAQDYLSTLGVDATVVEGDPMETEEVVGYSLETTAENTQHPYNTVMSSQGGASTAATSMDLVQVKVTPKEEFATKVSKGVGLKVTTANKSSGGNIKNQKSAPAQAKKRSGGGGGGGGGSSKAAEPIKLTKHSDIVDRYKEVDDTLDNVRDAFEDVEKITERLYGVSHISGLKYQNKLLQQEIGLLKDKVKEAKAYLAVDKQELANAAAKAGVSVQFGVEGDITNYTASMNKLFDELHAAEVYWNNTYHGKTQEDQQKYQEEVLDPIKEKIDDFKDAVSQYDETKELIEDLQNEIDDKFYEWQDNNYETLHYKLEFEIELNDLQLTELEYYLKKLEDDFYSLAEAGQYMSDQIPVWLESLGFHEDFYKGMDGTVDLKQISQLNFVEGTMESIEAIYETLQELNDLDKAMKEYYGKTLEMANEELEGHIDHLEHLTDVLDHYKNIVTMINGEMDYGRIGTILQGYADSIASELDVLQARYQMLQTEKEAIQTSYNNAANEAEKEIFREELEAITKAVDEAQKDMLDKTEDWADAMKAILENTIAAAGKELEDAFTFNMGFDSLSSSLDRLSSFHEEYLTKANQIYETQKLMRKAQQDADKTENQASKIKLKSFIDETQQLQNKTQMSKLDLEIQQAKYDLLLAQIALEDAQNAKSTVRLQRDNEGNFGYVYTADQEMIGEKEQELADAENALYNIGLEAANDYGNKRLELQQQLADELVTLNERRNNGEFETDALYYAERDRIIAEYTNLFTAYSNQYTTALGVDAQIQRDSWIQAYSEMIDNTLLWKDKTTEYLGNCEDAYDEWRNAVVEKGEIINDVLTNTSGNVEKLTNESKELATELQDNLIPLINQELVAVRNITSAYAALREELQKIIQHYEELAAQMRDKVEEEAYKDRFEYSREMEQAGNFIGVTPELSYSEVQELVPTRKTGKISGVGSIFNVNTGKFEVMDYEGLIDYYMSYYWTDARKANSKLTESQMREVAEAAAQAKLIDDKDVERFMGGDDEISDAWDPISKQIFESPEDLAQTMANMGNLLIHNTEEGARYLNEKNDDGNLKNDFFDMYSKAFLAAANNEKNKEDYEAYKNKLYSEYLKKNVNKGALTQAEWEKQFSSTFADYGKWLTNVNRVATLDEMFGKEIEAYTKEWAERQSQNNNLTYHITGTGANTQVVWDDTHTSNRHHAFDDTYEDAIASGKTEDEAIKEAVVAGNKVGAHDRERKKALQEWQAKKDAYNAYIKELNAYNSAVNNLKAQGLPASYAGSPPTPVSNPGPFSFATGGIADFTGPAWLDGTKQKPELVLNPDDTKNFLAATDMLRTISQTIDLQAMASQVNLNTPPGLFNEYDRALEQMVHIEANFPAVQDRNEIEAAFDNLINTAAQYANRKY